MKKFLLIASLLATISCTHQNQSIKLDISFDEKKSNIGNGSAIDVVVFDDRANREIIGKKVFGDEKITISPEQNLALLLEQKIKDNLSRKGFVQGGDKIVEIHIESLEYLARRRFFIGTSKANGELKVIVSNVRSGERFTKNFTLAVKNKHFIAPLTSTDANTINEVLQELVQDILNDKAVLKNLAN